METLTNDELAYHQRALTQLRAAQTVWESWASHLVEKYGLGPQDSISQEGNIVRPAPDGEDTEA